jgi:hypothetical protein
MVRGHTAHRGPRRARRVPHCRGASVAIDPASRLRISRFRSATPPVVRRAHSSADNNRLVVMAQRLLTEGCH